MLNGCFDVSRNANASETSMQKFGNNNISGHRAKTKFDGVPYAAVSKGNFLIYTTKNTHTGMSANGYLPVEPSK